MLMNGMAQCRWYMILYGYRKERKFPFPAQMLSSNFFGHYEYKKISSRVESLSCVCAGSDGGNTHTQCGSFTPARGNTWNKKKEKEEEEKKGQIDILELGLAVFLESAIDVRALR